MRPMTILVIVGAFVAMLLVMEFYPHLEGIMTSTGTQLANATGYTPNRAGPEAAKTALWGVFPAIIIIALFLEMYTKDHTGVH